MRSLMTMLALMYATGCGTWGNTHHLGSAPGWTPPKSGSGEHAEAGEVDEDHDDVGQTNPAVLARAASVRVLQNESAGCTAEALGPVDVHKKMESTEQALQALKVRAAALGAEAIIGVEFEHGEGGRAVTHLSGMAVRCKDLLRGRAYDVLREIRVSGAMGREHEAFAELRVKARALRADLVLDVRFEHGEGDSTTLRGTAIRLRR